MSSVVVQTDSVLPDQCVVVYEYLTVKFVENREKQHSEVHQREWSGANLREDYLCSK